MLSQQSSPGTSSPVERVTAASVTHPLVSTGTSFPTSIHGPALPRDLPSCSARANHSPHSMKYLYSSVAMLGPRLLQSTCKHWGICAVGLEDVMCAGDFPPSGLASLCVLVSGL